MTNLSEMRIDTYRFARGRYKGRSLAEIYKSDPVYIMEKLLAHKERLVLLHAEGKAIINYLISNCTLIVAEATMVNMEMEICRADWWKYFFSCNVSKKAEILLGVRNELHSISLLDGKFQEVPVMTVCFWK